MKVSNSTIEILKRISLRFKTHEMGKIIEHILEYQDDLQKAMDVFIRDSSFYKPYETDWLGEVLILMSKEYNENILSKKHLIRPTGII